MTRTPLGALTGPRHSYMGIKIKKIAYHRNGVAGSGFHVILFTWKDGRTRRNMVATVFEGKGDCAVLDVDATALGHLDYPENRWRGDDFEPELRRAIQSWWDERDDRLFAAVMLKTPENGH